MFASAEDLPATPPGETSAGVQIVHGAEQTEAIGRSLASSIRPGDVILIEGEVGAGKSTLIRAALRDLGVIGAIPSPTFTIGRFYGEPHQRVAVAHLDLYRLGGEAEEDPGLLSEYFGLDRATFVEWPGQVGEEFAAEAPRTFRVSLEHLDETSRKIRVEGPS